MIGLGWVVGVTRGAVERRRRRDHRHIRGSAKKEIVRNVILAVFLCALTLGLAPAQAMTLPGTFNVSERGAATYRIPIAVPPGTAGMVPALSLDYNSQGGGGLIGMGWSLSGLPSIGRCARTMAQDGVRGTVKYDANDRFCMEGQRLVLITGVYGTDGSEYRTEVEGYSKVVAHGAAGNGPAWFEVKTKSGQTMEFGNTVDSRVLAQGKTTARSWGVSKILDTKGNYLTVAYENNATNGETYPLRIDYTGNAAAGLSPYNSVQFIWGPRVSNGVSSGSSVQAYQAGSLITETKALQKIQTYEGANLVNDYRLAYAPGEVLRVADTFRMKLVSVELCDKNGVCLPKTSFESPPAPGALINFVLCGEPFFPPCEPTPPQPPSFVTTATSAPPLYHGAHTADFDGDGRTDLFFCRYDGQARCSTEPAHIWLSNGNGTFSETIGSIVPTANVGVFPGDFNGDGKTDLFFCVRDTFFRCLSVTSYLRISNGNGTFSNVTLTTPPEFSLPSFGDFDGDGRTDIFFCRGDGDRRCNTTQSSVWLSNGNGTFGVVNSNVVPLAGAAVLAGDFDGDGKTDLFICSADGSGRCAATASYLRLSNGNGTFANITGAAVPLGSARPFLADFNGDRQTDILFCAGSAGNCATNGSTMIWTSKGDGTFVQAAGPGTSNRGIAVLGDLNGSGTTDVLWCVKDSSQRCNMDGTYLWNAASMAGNSFTGLSSDALPANALLPISGDFTGNGRTDIWFCIGDDFGRCTGSTSYLWTLGAPTLPAVDLLSSFTTGFGLKTTITYRPITDDAIYTKGTDGVYPVVDVQAPMHVVTRVDADDGIGGLYSSTYAYEGAKVDLDGRGFLGFRRHVATDLETGIVQTTNFLQTFPYTGLSSLQTKVLGIQTLNEIVTSYTATNLGATRTFVAPSQTVDRNWDLDGSPIPAVTTSYAYDAFGNATTVTVATPDGASKTTANSYANDTVNWWLGRLTGTAVTSTVP